MKNFDELLKTLNELKITQKSMDWLEDLPNDIWEEYFKTNEIKCIKSDLDVDKHRWYETSITVYKYQDRFFGVRSVTNVFSEQSEVEDMFHTLKFFEMKEVITITYKKI